MQVEVYSSLFLFSEGLVSHAASVWLFVCMYALQTFWGEGIVQNDACQ